MPPGSTVSSEPIGAIHLPAGDATLLLKAK
jgi:hypothetical protein